MTNFISFSKVRMEGSPPRRRRRLLLNDEANPQPDIQQNRVKLSPCSYCQLDLDVTNFEEHLLNSNICRSLYMKSLGVATVDGILMRTFDCIFCPAKFCKLTDHLRMSAACKDRYFQRLGVDNLKWVIILDDFVSEDRCQQMQDHPTIFGIKSTQ